MSDTKVEDLRKRPKARGRKDRFYMAWFDYLLMLASARFRYDNLPSSLSSWELEKRLIFSGYCCVFHDETYGLVTSWGGLSGVNIYNMPNSFSYAQAVLGSRSDMDNLIDGVIMYGSSIDKLGCGNGYIGRRIAYYADLLSDIDTSKQIALITARNSKTVVAKSDNALKELKNYYNKLIDGEVIIPKIVSGALSSTEDLLKGTGRELVLTVGDYDVALQNALQRFYAEFGISYSPTKRERLISDEIEATLEGVEYNIGDFLECRRQGVEQINFMYGTNIVVRGGVDNYDT